MNDSVNDLIDASEKSENELTITKDIFNALVNGFNRNTNIHYTSTTSIKEMVSILPIITALNACINDDDITQQDVENAFELIYEKSTLTVNAQNRWYEIYFKSKSKSSNHPGALFTIIKTHNPQYYEESVKPLITKQFKETSPQDFENERYTINDYKNEFVNFKTYENYISNLVKCVAFIDDGKYIVKMKDDEHDKLMYQVCDEKRLKKILKFVGTWIKTVKLTDENIESLRKKHKKIPESKTINVPVKFSLMEELIQVNVQALHIYITDFK